MKIYAFLFFSLRPIICIAHRIPVEKATEDLRRVVDPLGFGKTTCFVLERARLPFSTDYIFRFI